MDEIPRLENKLESLDLDRRNLLQKTGDLYFEPKAIEKWGNSKIYEMLGVRQFKKLVVKYGDLVGKEDNPYRRSQSQLNSKEKLASLEHTTRLVESVHSPFTLLFAYQTADNLANGNYVGASINGVIGLLNAYCSMAQRYQRTRISTIVDRMESR